MARRKEAIKLVEQEEAKGCTIACIAMVLGKGYWDVRKHFINDFEREAMTVDQLKDYLGDAGFSILSKRISHYNIAQFGREEMLKPFAPVHIVWYTQFFDMQYSHVVVMDAEGNTYDPAQNEPELIKDAYAVHETIGLYR